MKFGLNILNFGPNANPESLLRQARMAEELGCHFAMISDHVAVTPDVQAPYPTPFYDPFITLSWLAGVTKIIELGTTVAILPFRHPLLTARMGACLDRLSGGRFILGVGVGWARQEFEALGVPFHQRGAIANEYLDVIRKCWTNDVVSYDGQWVKFQDVHTGPWPVREPHPPIWVGGSSEAALRRAVRYGDGWHPLRFRIGWLKDEGCPALRRIAGEESRPVPALCPRIQIRVEEQTLDDHKRFAGQGTLDQIRGDIEALADLGAESVLLDTTEPATIYNLFNFLPF